LVRDVSFLLTSSGSSVNESSTSATTGDYRVRGGVPRVGRNDHLVARTDSGTDQAADQRRGARVDAKRVLRAHVRGKLALEVDHLMRSVADAVVTEDVVAADHPGCGFGLLLAELHAAREHRLFRPRARWGAAVAREP
jgi:hypothetical protein